MTTTGDDVGDVDQDNGDIARTITLTMKTTMMTKAMTMTTKATMTTTNADADHDDDGENIKGDLRWVSLLPHHYLYFRPPKRKLISKT